MSYTKFFDKVVVAGAGSAYWLVFALCRDTSGMIPIEVYDDDTFEGGNGFRRLPKAISPLAYKVDLLRAQVVYVMGDIPPKIHRRKLLPSELLNGDWTRTLVVDCTDMSIEDRKEWWKALKASNAKGLRMALDGTGVATVSPGPPLISGNGGRQGYGVTPGLSQAMRAAGQGAEAILYYLLTGKPLEFQTFVPTAENETNEITEREDIYVHNSNYSQVSDSPTIPGTDRDRTQDIGDPGGSREGPERVADSAARD
jgi:hypothetical protein